MMSSLRLAALLFFSCVAGAGATSLTMTSDYNSGTLLAPNDTLTVQIWLDPGPTDPSGIALLNVGVVFDNYQFSYDREASRTPSYLLYTTAKVAWLEPISPTCSDGKGCDLWHGASNLINLEFISSRWSSGIGATNTTGGLLATLVFHVHDPLLGLPTIEFQFDSATENILQYGSGATDTPAFSGSPLSDIPLQHDYVAALRVGHPNGVRYVGEDLRVGDLIEVEVRLNTQGLSDITRLTVGVEYDLGGGFAGPLTYRKDLSSTRTTLLYLSPESPWLEPTASCGGGPNSPTAGSGCSVVPTAPQQVNVEFATVDPPFGTEATTQTDLSDGGPVIATLVFEVTDDAFPYASMRLNFDPERGAILQLEDGSQAELNLGPSVRISIAGHPNPEFTPLGFLATRSQESRALGVSADGRVVVGQSSVAHTGYTRNEAFRWTASLGLRSLGVVVPEDTASVAEGISADGSTIVGHSEFPGGREAFRYRGGMLGLGFSDSVGTLISGMTDASADGGLLVGDNRLFGDHSVATSWDDINGFAPLSPGDFDSHARAVSDDGVVIVGNLLYPESHAFRWTAAAGVSELPDLPGGLLEHGAEGISGDGAVVVGWGTDDSGRKAVKWDAATSVIESLEIEGAAYAASGDATVIVGSSGADGFIWYDGMGLRNFRTQLANSGIDVSGWPNLEPRDVSADGTVIVGFGTNPSGRTEGFRAALPRLRQVPEPDLLVLLATGCLGLLALRSRRPPN